MPSHLELQHMVALLGMVWGCVRPVLHVKKKELRAVHTVDRAFQAGLHFRNSLGSHGRSEFTQGLQGEVQKFTPKSQGDSEQWA